MDRLLIQNNHRLLQLRGSLGTQWIQTNHRGFSNLGTLHLDAQLCPQVTLGSLEPIKDS